MKYGKFKQIVNKLEEVANVEISIPSKKQFKSMSEEEQIEILQAIKKRTFTTFVINFTTDDIEKLIQPSDNIFTNEEENNYASSKPTEQEAQPSIDSILAERGSNYGEFSNHAHLSQTLKSIFDAHVREYGQPELFTDTINEAIEMIFHKLARIGNGDPTYTDSWTDLIGYTQLVINELEGGKSR